MPEYPRSPFEKTGTSITPSVNGDALDATPIGGTTPAAGSFTTIKATGQLQGDLINNHMVSKVTFDILGLMTDPRFLNLQCEDPGAGTMTDVSGQGHDGTYQGSMTTGDRDKKGMGWSIDYDSIDDYIDIGDADDFSFGDGTNDEAVTWFGVFEIVNTTGYQSIITKYDSTSGSELREWMVLLDGDEKLLLYQYDESANVGVQRLTDAALSAGYHSIVITSPGDGGAAAMNNVRFYIDGVIVASTATNDASYVSMENLSADCLIGTRVGSLGVAELFTEGDSAMVGMDGSEWSAMDAHRFYQLCKGLYGI